MGDEMRDERSGIGRWLLVVGLASTLAMVGCGDDEEPADNQEQQEEKDNQNKEIEECEIEYVIPEGDSFALQATALVEPASIASLTAGYMDSVPPLLFIAKGLTDGVDDEVEVVGGIGERVSYGYDETPNTVEDVYSMYYGSINPSTCDFQARLQGDTVQYDLNTAAEEMNIDLSGFSSLTEGLSLHVEEVTLTGTFDEDLNLVDEAVLKGRLSDDGLGDLVDAVGEYITMTEEQARRLLDPDDTGEILVELELSGRRAVVDGFIDVEEGEPVEPRIEEPCCPDGLEVGDSIIPYLSWEQQGIDEAQYELFQMALPEFRADSKVAMVVTARRQSDGDVHYEVYSGGAVDEGMIAFRREAGNGGQAPEFHVVEQAGANPLENMDPTALSEYEELLSLGENPNEVTYVDEGYLAGDPRVAFVPPQQMHYPFAMERIAQNFDDPRTGDLMIIPASWSTGGFGTHGNLGALQSRSPLVIFGPGVRNADENDGVGYVAEMGDGEQTLLFEDAVRQVDIAPTVAAALGVEQTVGVGPDMRLRDDVFLKWQDGRVLQEVFTDDAWDAIESGDPVAERAVIIINDGLTNTELLYQVLSDDPEFEVDAYRRMFASGAAFEFGSISNFPSNTYPGHNTIGSGAWAGHHGVIDNNFWVREQSTQASPISELFETEHLMGSAHSNLPVETLHEAVMRTFGTLAQGVLAASINEPSSRGAEFSTLERRIPEGFETPEDAETLMVGENVYELPPADIQDYAALMDNDSAITFATLFQDHIERGEDGLPIPHYTIVNFGSTDTAGHAHGPHGDHERYTVISRVNQRMAAMLDLLEYLEIDDSTLVVLTSDHGMELQDLSRSSSRGRALSQAGVSTRRAGWYYYFLEFAVEVMEVEEDGGEVTYSLRVVDRATSGVDEPTGVTDVAVDVITDGEAETAYTDEEGYVEILVTPDSGADSVLFEFDNPSWNAHRERIGF